MTIDIATWRRLIGVPPFVLTKTPATKLLDELERLLAELERLRRLEAAVLEMDDQKELPIAEPVYSAYHGAIAEARAAKAKAAG